MPKIGLGEGFAVVLSERGSVILTREEVRELILGVLADNERIDEFGLSQVIDAAVCEKARTAYSVLT